MSTKTQYTYPTKLKKFGIDDSFLKILVAKYEKEIPWQVSVKDTESLIVFIKDTMLPKLLKKAEWPPSESKQFYINEQTVNLELALTTDQELNREEIEQVRQCKSSKGDSEAIKLLTEFINKHKNESFEKWISLVTKKYKSNPAFQYLLLKPLFETSGSRSRRPLSIPSEDVIDWLYMRIIKERINPNYSLAKEYFLKSAFGSSQIIVDGWEYIHRGINNVRRLSSSAQGSGWCIASEIMARHYLLNSSFYILRSKGEAVVALRTKDKNIIECQGKFNLSPDLWYAEIHLFISTMNLDMTTSNRLKQYEEKINEINFKTTDIDWWKIRLSYWHFAINYMPDSIRIKSDNIEITDINKYLAFFSFEEIEEKLNTNFDKEDFLHILKINPNIYNDIPKSRVKEYEQLVEEACKTGWIDKIEDRELSAYEILKIPKFVTNTEEYKKALVEYFPVDLTKMMLKRPRNASERINRTKLDSIIPSSINEHINIAKLRALNILINNQTSDFSDNIFPEELRSHDSFIEIRKDAWINAFKDNSTFYFALPYDLKNEAEFSLDKTPIDTIKLKEWSKKIEDKPWLLTQKAGVPKSFRYREEILVAYINGWIPHLIKNPWRLWKPSAYTRAYISYAALMNTQIINALILGFQKGYDSKKDLFKSASFRTSLIPAFQFAVLLGVFRSKNSNVYLTKIKAIYLNINKNNPPSNNNNIHTMYNIRFLYGDTSVYKTYNTEGETIFKMSSFNLINNINRRLKSGDKFKILLNGKESSCVINSTIKGFTLVSTLSPLGKIVVGLREGDSFKFEKTSGKILQIL